MFKPDRDCTALHYEHRLDDHRALQTSIIPKRRATRGRKTQPASAS
jgi:hypothetical protein